MKSCAAVTISGVCRCHRNLSAVRLNITSTLVVKRKTLFAQKLRRVLSRLGREHKLASQSLPGDLQCLFQFSFWTGWVILQSRLISPFSRTYRTVIKWFFKRPIVCFFFTRLNLFFIFNKKKSISVSAEDSFINLFVFNTPVLIGAYKKNVLLCSWLHSTQHSGCQVCMVPLFLTSSERFAAVLLKEKSILNNWWSTRLIFETCPKKRKIIRMQAWLKKKNPSLQPDHDVETPLMWKFALWLHSSCKKMWNISVFYCNLYLIFGRQF